MSGGIAIVGMACTYPDARTPWELWENALAGRRAFRQIPAERLSLADYWSANRDAPDRTYARHAAVLSDFTFDRSRYRVSSNAYRSADPSHWLALDCAAEALEDAGWPGAEGLDRSAVGVVVGNTLTGDYSRAAALRLRWPYVQKVLAAALNDEGLPAETSRELLTRAAGRYRDGLPQVDGETLAGWLSNTIAGRICNHFGFHGGGYVVDGACSSSLLAVATACSALTAGDLDVAIAGGVDLSLDPFELVGFARAGALATNEMKVYDRTSDGFWPGEGCGFVVLIREADARAAGLRRYALVRGWGVSSDGPGGLTRPEVHGQLLALRRAYARAGYGIETVGYFEGHGTGTAVGDNVELAAVSTARREAGARAPAVIGTIKANIGHTKAAAGIAGLIKAAMAVHRGVLPVVTGCAEPHAALMGADRQLQVLRRSELWPSTVPRRAGVSAMGFGGINTHVTLEAASRTRPRLNLRERACVQSEQDAELIVMSAERWSDLLGDVGRLRDRAASMSRAELTDAAVATQRGPLEGSVRLAMVARGVSDLEGLLARAATAIEEQRPIADPDAGLFLSRAAAAPRIAFVFPGQGSPANADGGAWVRRFARVRSLYRDAGAPAGLTTHSAQLAIMRASIAALRVLQRIGIEGHVAAGHSLGELVALHWAGSMDETTLARIVDARGRAMAEQTPAGAMAAIGADARAVRTLTEGTPAVIAAYNAPRQVVVSGPDEAVRDVSAAARDRGWSVAPLRVAHAFHSPAMDSAADSLRAALDREALRPVARRVYSTISGTVLRPETQLSGHLVAQLVQPVRFAEVAAALIRESDLVIEVGPGDVLTGLMHVSGHDASVSVDACGSSMSPLLVAAAWAWAVGASVRMHELAAGRCSRPFRIERPQFLVNPCESVPAVPDDLIVRAPADDDGTAEHATPSRVDEAPSPTVLRDPMAAAMAVAAARADLPVETIRPAHRLLRDLHFNSLTAAQIVVDIAARLGAEPPPQPLEFVDASIEEIVEVLTTARAASASATSRWLGVNAWVRTFRVIAGPIEPRRGDRAVPAAPAGWRIVCAPGHPLHAALERDKESFGGHGTIVCLSSSPGDDEWLSLAQAAREMARTAEPRSFVVVHDAGGGAGLAASLAQEAPHLVVVALQVPFDADAAGRWVLEEATCAEGFVHAAYDRSGARRTVMLEMITPPPSCETLTKDDVVLVSGGGKGIAAECALALAVRTGATLALLGRADPETDGALRSTLSRLAGAGVRYAYERADVADADAVSAAVARMSDAVGPITAIVHAAGVNQPALIAAATDDEIRAALAVKLAGVRHMLAAVDRRRLRLLVAFGSIIARTGMRGEAHYALANEALRCFIDDESVHLPACRCLTVESSVWSGAGMGERLGVIAGLERRGISPIPLETGVEVFLDLLGSSAAGSIVVSGRFGDIPGLPLAGAAPPVARFVERARVWYPGIELVADVDVSSDTDHYLSDHVIDGQRVLPGVIGLEAIVQAAAALTGVAPRHPWTFREVVFHRAIVVPDGDRCVIRIAALLNRSGEVEVAVRSAATGFAVDHFTAFCRPGATLPHEDEGARAGSRRADSAADVTADSLYDEVFFQRGRFRRVVAYRELHARRCVVDVAAPTQERYFSSYHPQALWLGDPGVRDAVIHALQACIPLQRLVPTHIDRLIVVGDAPSGCRVEASERGQNGATYVYDVIVRDPSGYVVERWDGLHLRAIGALTYRRAIPMPLLEPWVEREWLSVAGDTDLRVSRLSADEEGEGLRAVQAVCASVRRGADGRPVPAEPNLFASASHDKGVALGLVGSVPLGCDLQSIADMNAMWPNLLGRNDADVARHLAREAGEALEAAATRIWSAREALHKCGAPSHLPLLVTAITLPVVRLRAGDHTIGTVLMAHGGHERICALAAKPGSNPDVGMPVPMAGVGGIDL